MGIGTGREHVVSGAGYRRMTPAKPMQPQSIPATVLVDR